MLLNNITALQTTGCNADAGTTIIAPTTGITVQAQPLVATFGDDGAELAGRIAAGGAAAAVCGSGISPASLWTESVKPLVRLPSEPTGSVL